MDPLISMNQKVSNSVFNQDSTTEFSYSCAHSGAWVWTSLPKYPITESFYCRAFSSGSNFQTHSASAHFTGDVWADFQRRPDRPKTATEYLNLRETKDFISWPHCSLAILQYEHANSGFVRWCQHIGEANKKGKCSRSATATQHGCAEISVLSLVSTLDRALPDQPGT